MNPALQTLLQNPSIWLGGQVEHAAAPTVASGFELLDAQLPGGGWPQGALTELLHLSEGIGEVALLLPTLARLNREGRGVVWIAPPHLPYAPALRAAEQESAPRQLALVMAPVRKDPPRLSLHAH